MGSVVVCGFYTEDYRRWLIPLVTSLDQLGQPHDFVLAEKAGHMWETRWRCRGRSFGHSAPAGTRPSPTDHPAFRPDPWSTCPIGSAR
jgi:hypothetical protein